MKTLWQPETRRELVDRVTRLDRNATPRWGRMSAPQVLAHLVDALRMALGMLPVASRRLPIRHPPLKQFIIYWMPFPKDAPTAPELVARSADDWEGDVRTFADLVAEFARRDDSGPWTEHPAFGAMTGRRWGVLVYRHSDHHLRQFGV